MDKNERRALYTVQGFLMGTVENKFNSIPDEVVEYATHLLQLLEDKLEGTEEEL
ncbi:hypothetical protein [Lysinibacillus sphaericus]|uniref:hypothetical protein n=1 Tax=Lysinibacillus sphaericus TaxID=1421 RepID=UPI0018CC92DB|nr:hypothetical protein [Lysinibacillus sphaericus]